MKWAETFRSHKKDIVGAPRDALGHSTNLVGIPTGLLASPRFNDAPVALHIAGAREMSRALFDMLAEAPTALEAAPAFTLYMGATFALDPEQREPTGRHYRSSYRRVLKGWGYDANGPEGAVLKGWVESRFGLFPTFHKAPLTRLMSEDWMMYVTEKMSSRFHNNAIMMQLDILFEYCQWTIKHFHMKDMNHVILYRGVNAIDEHYMVEREARNLYIVRLNNLTSFSADREMAGCFGDYILEARVPAVKILFFNTLLPQHPLKGEGEYLVIGGDYRVTVQL